MTPINLDRLSDRVAAITDATLERYEAIENEATFVISPEHILAITQMLISEFECQHLSAITAQQREDQEDEIEVLYHFWQGIGFSFMMVLPVSSPILPSIKPILPGADFYEREAAEMFGITFTGRDETPPLLLPDNWSGGPPFIRSEDDHA